MRSVVMVSMNDLHILAYRFLLAQGLLHLKWDLARFYDGLSLGETLELFIESQAVYVASCRAFAFHNLAICSAGDFTRFSEDIFWVGIEKFRREFPDALCPYREVFERCLPGQAVSIAAPNGVARSGEEVP